VSTSGQADTKEAGGKRRRWALELKRELVAATFEPGSSVSIVARRHDINANQLFKWRRELGGASAGSMELARVEVTPTPPSGPLIEVGPSMPAGSAAGRIEIWLPRGVRVKIEGSADPGTVSAVLGAVMKMRRRRR
jgi:transposase